MKNRVILLVVMMCGLLVGANTLFAQFNCPPNPPGTIINHNCEWFSRFNPTPFSLLLPDGYSCDATIYWCERCCNGKSEFFLQALELDMSCYTPHSTGVSLESKMIMDQVRLKLFHQVCDGSTGYIEPIPPCPDPTNSAIVTYLHKAQCYSQTVTTYTNGTSVMQFRACSNIIGCTNYYSVCFDGTNYKYTYINTAYSAPCPNTNGCNGFCDENQP